eukprot:5374275-Prymnesium_polylepis.1
MKPSGPLTTTRGERRSRSTSPSNASDTRPAVNARALNRSRKSARRGEATWAYAEGPLASSVTAKMALLPALLAMHSEMGWARRTSSPRQE